MPRKFKINQMLMRTRKTETPLLKINPIRCN